MILVVAACAARLMENLVMVIRQTIEQIHGRSRKMAEDRNLMGALVFEG